ncbi:MAG: YafY family transcriptional regulator [Oscillospiraceae bacterium]|nr:YafY family transcriptional regulator [Oscillospiraceae bacterium]
MKTDRLLSIVIYLLNHDKTSAAKLAEKFEVSKRTIIRDIEQISLSGIPIKSLPGANGGYSIMEGYKIDGQLISAEDQTSIITALKGFLSAYGNKRYNEVLEKISLILPKQQTQNIFLDFGASGENDETQAKLKILEKAINDKKAVNISYVNAYGGSTSRLVEPVVLNYRWYAWYLLAFCTIKQDYRVFKLVRISEIETTETAFSEDHGSPADLLEQAFQGDGRKSLEITMLCKAEVKIQVCEYLSGTITETYENGDFIMRMNVIEDERMWFALLLSFGDKITVLEPEEVKIRLTNTAKKILLVYNE